jgi:hypothetical protein
VNCRESSMWLSIYGCASLVSYFTIRFAQGDFKWLIRQ